MFMKLINILKRDLLGIKERIVRGDYCSALQGFKLFTGSIKLHKIIRMYIFTIGKL